MHFLQGSIPESLVKKNIRIDKGIQLLLKVATQIEYRKDIVSFQQTLNNFVNSDFFSPNSKGLILVKNALIY